MENYYLIILQFVWKSFFSYITINNLFNIIYIIMKRPKKNPNRDYNWREKRRPGYGTTQQKDNYIIKNFIFEEIKVGV